MLRFREVYRVTPVEGNTPQRYRAFIALGVVQNSTGDFGPDYFRFCRNNPVKTDWGIFGRVMEESEDRVVVVDARSPEVLWVFEPLTLVRWREMIKDEAVHATGEEFSNDGDLFNFYWQDWMFDEWEEWKDAGKFKEELEELIANGGVP